jgi:lipoprotein LpqH
LSFGPTGWPRGPFWNSRDDVLIASSRKNIPYTTEQAAPRVGVSAKERGDAKQRIGSARDSRDLRTATVGGNVTITIGQGTTGIVAVVSDSDPPVVHSVALGNVNGMTLGYQEAVSDAEAQASRNGNFYNITGTAAGVDKSYPKPFEIDVTCP